MAPGGNGARLHQIRGHEECPPHPLANIFVYVLHDVTDQLFDALHSSGWGRCVVYGDGLGALFAVIHHLAVGACEGLEVGDPAIS